MLLDKNLVNSIKNFSLSMYRKNFIGIFHGSISAKSSMNTFIINKKDAVFDNIVDNDLIELNMERDFRWEDASIDCDIHLEIYQQIEEAKCICYVMPEFMTSLSIKYDIISPRDYFGATFVGDIEVYNPKNFDNWYERAKDEICKYFIENSTNFIVIRGYGIYAYGRELSEIAKKIALIENACKIIYRTKVLNGKL